jgi:hypothetical protein
MKTRQAFSDFLEIKGTRIPAILENLACIIDERPEMKIHARI